MDATTHLLMKESLHVSDDSKPHRIGLRYTCSIPYSLTINIYSQKYQCKKRKGKQSVFRSKGYNYQWSAFLTSIFVIRVTPYVSDPQKRKSHIICLLSQYKSYRFPSSFLHKTNTKQRINIPKWINPKAIKANRHTNRGDKMLIRWRQPGSLPLFLWQCTMRSLQLEDN